jgi:Pentapeptide repeats (8 copies)
VQKLTEAAMSNQRNGMGEKVQRFLVRFRWPALTIIAIGLLLWLVLLAPKLLVPARSSASLGDVKDSAKRHELEDSRLKLQNDVRTTLLQGLGGAVLLSGAFLTWRQLQVSKEGQVTERFTRAIDQLGSDKLDVRLGAIFTLDRIAKDSPTDLGAVAEVLASYIREHSPWPPRDAGTRSSQLQAQGPFEMQRLPTLRVRAADVQAALTVLAQRLAVKADFVNLAATDLRSANLRFAKFGRASLWGSNLQGARIHSANLANVLLNMADFKDARADEFTIWPRDFDWKSLDVIIEDTGDYP